MFDQELMHNTNKGEWIWKNNFLECTYPLIQLFPYPKDIFRYVHKDEYVRMFTIGYLGK